MSKLWGMIQGPVLAMSLVAAPAGMHPGAVMARSNLLAFAIGVSPRYETPAHLRLLARKLEAVERGEITRLIVTMPPRHGKSDLISEKFAAWCMGRNPHWQVMTATYSQRLANKWGRRVRNTMLSEPFREPFPEAGLAYDAKAAAQFETTAGGCYLGTGIGGAATGMGADLLIVDDPLKGRAEAESITMRENCKEWWSDVAYTRLMPGGRVVIVLTRWHEDDLAGWLLREHKGEGWVVVNLPALAEEGDMLGRPVDAPLWPERYPTPVLERIKRALGTRSWLALYQQRPTASEGGVFKRAWFKFYKKAGLPKLDRQTQSWDMAFKDTKKSDFVSGQVWARAGVDHYLLDRVHARMDFVGTCSAMLTLTGKWPLAIAKLVEDKANGPAVMSALKGKVVGLVPVEPEGGKVSRANAVAPVVEGGNVYLPDPSEAPWVHDFIEELVAFPNATNDDDVDSMTQYLARELNLGNPSPAQVVILPPSDATGDMADFMGNF